MAAMANVSEKKKFQPSEHIIGHGSHVEYPT
jgi:hypothetical protein